MFASYLITALRTIKKDQQHFLLNVIGFSIGIAAAILMALFAQHELSYDKHQPDSERVYLSHTDYTARGLRIVRESSFSVADRLKNHSQVEAIFKFTDAKKLYQKNNVIQVDGTYHTLNRFYATTRNILDFIALDILAGDITQALSQPNLLVLSETEALRLFGELQVLGRTLNHANGQYTIGAIFKDLPENTHFSFNSLIAMPNQYARNGAGNVYFKLRKNTDIAALNQRLTSEAQKENSWQAKHGITTFLMNLEKLHLHSNGPFVMKKGGSSTVLQIVIALSVMLILIASINFINLNIAQSAKRAKEVGVRKALGATKAQLVAQFMTESLLVVFLSALLAFAMVETSLPTFNQLMGRQLSLNYASEFMFVSLAVIFIVGLLSGLYPALFIASFNANRVLSGDLVRGKSAIFVRKLTLCLQSALSVGLIIAAITLYQQMQLVNNLAVGYEKSSRLVIKNLQTEALFTPNHNRLFTALKNLTGVAQVTSIDTDLTNDMLDDMRMTWPNGEQIEGTQPLIRTGFHAVETLGLKLLAGRDFSPEFSSDWYKEDKEGNKTVSVIVTRRLAELAGYQDLQSAIGVTVTEPLRKVTGKIVGVVEDVKIGSARQLALPVSFHLGSNRSKGHIVIKVANADLTKLSHEIQKIVSEQLHLSHVEVTRLSDDYANAHKNEQRALNMVTIFSLLAIYLTCLGTFGLASFATLRRQKEVAMRKVLGASRLSIINLLAKEFLLLVAISIAIAFPLSYWLVADWLANFNERIEQTFWVYIFAALAIAAITWLTVASLAFKAASTRPSLILRYE